MTARRKTLADLGDRDLTRTLTILRDDRPAIAGVLEATNSSIGRVSVVLNVLGMRVRLDPLPANTACIVTSKETPQ
jgi:hypothetical protein